MREALMQSTYFGVFLSLIAYAAGTWINRRFRLAILNPLLIAVALVIAFLSATKIDYQTYNEGSKLLTYLLTPTTVSLAIPLYAQLSKLKQNMRAILIGILAGILSNLTCIFLLALLFRLNHAEYVTLLPKSITTAIGLSLAENMGGYPAITAIAIMIAGIGGNIFAPAFLKLVRITEPVARGVALGTASHAIGTARAMEMGEIEGAMSSLSIAVCGLMTVVAASIFAMFI